jgi:hypothetical protein
MGINYPLWSPSIGDVPPATINSQLGGSTSTATALTTVGAGTITAAGIAGAVTLRSGSTSAFTDTTDTAANIIPARWPNSASLNSSFMYTYVNNSVAVATIQGGTGVTVSGITVVPPNSWARFLLTYTAANTLTMVGIEQGYFPSSGTVTANAATPVAVANTAVTATSQVLLTYVSGTQGATGAFVSSRTAGTGFSIKSVASDTAVYAYTILG